jgi:hypothetical protein
MNSHIKNNLDSFLKNTQEPTSEGNQFMQTDKLMQIAPNNNTQQEMSRQSSDINIQKKCRESSYKTVDIGQAFGVDIQQIIESDLVGSKSTKYKKKNQKICIKWRMKMPPKNRNIETDIAKNKSRAQMDDIENVQILNNDEMLDF